MARCEEEKTLREEILEVLREYYSIDRVPHRLLSEAVRELRQIKNLSREIILKYIQQILMPELNRIYIDNVKKYKQKYGWGQIRKLIHFIVSDQLMRLGYSVHIRPLVDSTRVDLLVEYYGKYLPILIRTEKHDKVTLYKSSRLKSKGIPVFVMTITRDNITKDKIVFVPDIQRLERELDEHGVHYLKYVVDRYESTLFEIWRTFVNRGYIVFRNIIEGSYMFDLMAVGYSRVGVKKLTKSIFQSSQRLRKLLNSVAQAIREGVIDEVLLLTPYEKFEDLSKELKRTSVRKVVDRLSILQI